MIVPKTLLPHASFLPLRLIPPYGLSYTLIATPVISCPSVVHLGLLWFSLYFSYLPVIVPVMLHVLPTDGSTGDERMT